MEGVGKTPRENSIASSPTDEAAQGLKKLGYDQELTRTRGLAHILFSEFMVYYGKPTSYRPAFGLAAPIATSLIGGGPAVMVWGLAVVSVFCQTLAMSLAEICSKYPTSAGAYYWSFRLASPRYRLLCSWINGWLTMVGVWTISLSVNFGTGQLVVAGAGIYHPEWVATPWQTYLIFLAVTAFATGFGIFFNNLLPTVDILSAVWTLLGMIVMLICLSIKAAAGRHSASFALGFFDPSSGWTAGWSFFIGLLPPAYTYAAIGMVASMCEEVREPSREVPLALAWSIPIGFLTGLLFLLPVVFTLPDITMLLAVPGGQPIAVLLTAVMGSRGGGFGMVLFMIGIFCAISICCAASRATWSFARDNAIPYPKFFAKINHGFLKGVPLNAYILSTLVQVFLGLIFLGSSTAFNAFVGVAVICLGASYAMPVLLSVLDGRRQMKDAPYNLGRFGYLINWLAVLWVLFEIVLFSMPAAVPVTAITMNYASVVFIGFAVISALWYMINGRQHYSGPPIVQDDWMGKDSGCARTTRAEG
ncbi:amino acid transporter [Macrolepiota fuliginosa MF-IS2]|uniref:Amino acid transporter n=1 Tax=Macrolepiota fuliginosa MF-IS2 TaxID=1400762 RepID=A0A9P5XIQ9_9AGAR|nr:amino acid transporter [Macrolepiota fuliginosa MF-IS2]